LRVELGEIEAAILANEHIDAAAVLMIQGRHSVLVAFVVSSLSQPEVEKVVLAQCENRLPAYMRVTQVLKIEAMPLTSSNKTDYHQLKCLFEKAVLTHDKHLLEDTTVRKTEVVQGIRNIWQRYLRLGHLDGNRGFFDLGGTSLIAIQVMADIKKQYRLDAPLDLFLLNSFDEFSQAVLKINSSQHVEERLVVPLLPAKASSKKLFFVHGIGGGVLNYKALAAQLGDADVYGIQCRGLDGVSLPINDIKKMAALYVDAIKAIQSEGPYYLLGGSMGGVVAFEMACQLQNRGDQLASLIMFDSYPPGSYSTSNMFERIKNFLGIFNTISKNEKKDNASMMASDISQNLSSKLIKKSQSLLDFFYIKLSQWLNHPLGHAHRYDFIRDVHLKALQLYRPSEKFKGDVLYFKAGDDLHAQPGVEKRWETYLNGKLIVHVLPGSHDNLIENKALPAYLNQILFYLPS
ncbi:MAG TPA: alpha/beta fold hydrolase, partial [Pseudomonadales bacterium]|nr:alpha/beta fold hydrolase [Pseudomonadales bacterium]